MNNLKLLLLATPLLLAACSGGTPPAQPAASSAVSEAAAASAQPAAAATPAAADVLTPLFGVWAADLAQCATPGAGPITISATRFEGAENGCDISGYTDNGDGTYTAALSCASQGQTAAENIKMRPIFTPTGEGIDMVYLDRDNQAFTVLRCTMPKAN